MNQIQADIEEKLKQAFAPTQLELINESHLHAGHAGSPGTGNSHFALTMSSAAFAGKSRVAKHQMVHRVLAQELAGPVHALRMDLKEA